MEKYFDQLIADLKQKLKAKGLEVKTDFTTDALVFKDNKVIRVIPRTEYFKIARKVKEAYDLQKALENG